MNPPGTNTGPDTPGTFLESSLFSSIFVADSFCGLIFFTIVQVSPDQGALSALPRFLLATESGIVNTQTHTHTHTLAVSSTIRL